MGINRHLPRNIRRCGSCGVIEITLWEQDYFFQSQRINERERVSPHVGIDCCLRHERTVATGIFLKQFKGLRGYYEDSTCRRWGFFPGGTFCLTRMRARARIACAILASCALATRLRLWHLKTAQPNQPRGDGAAAALVGQR